MPFLRRHFLIACWLLLVVPTIGLGVVAWRALQAEERVLRDDLRLQYQREGERQREDVELFVRRMRQELMRTLREIDQTALESRLIALRQQEPYVRNVFIRDATGRLRLPNLTRPANREEAAFIERFASLFDNEGQWPIGADEDLAFEAPAPPPALAMAAPEPSYSTLRSRSSAEPPASRGRYAAEQEAEAFARRQNIVEERPRPARAEVAATADSVAVASAPTARSAPSRPPEPLRRPGDEGWIPWFWGSDFSFLGWVKTEPDGLVYGVEMEMAALYDRLPQVLPEADASSLGVALIDARGRTFHRSPHLPEALPTPDFTFDLGEALPYWRMLVYLPADWSTSLSGFRSLGRYIVGGVLFAILCSGTLLLWQADRNRRESLRKSTFVSNVSHELKTPLTTIRLHAEMLGENRVRDEAKRQRYLDTITEESQRLTRLVNNVLDFSRLEKNKQPRDPIRIELAAWLKNRTVTVRPRATEAGVTIALEAPATPLLVVADADALEQVFLNLVDNALKYASTGGTLDIQLSAEAESVAIAFADRGPGVPRGHRSRIFEAFHRVDHSLTAQSAGCGLGLNIAVRLLRAEGGSLDYRDRPGGGACFTVRLPRAPSAPAS